ncbi:MAG: hypothetical protein FWH24_02170 [Oscillospiraceae bacterium]|nr:hypothetical protein [Oscillospiraceae bacterium]
MKNVTGRTIRKLYVNQLIMSIFGIIVVTAASLADEALKVPASLLAAGLYLFIIYDAMWNNGAKDAAVRLRAEDAQLEKIKTPLFTALFASVFNLTGAAAYLILRTLVFARELTEGALVLAGDAVHLIMGYTNGMYLGFETTIYPHPHTGLSFEEIADLIEQTGAAPMFVTAPVFYFLIPIPLAAASIFAYYLGASEKKLTDLLRPKTNIK